ncbi:MULTISPECIES: DUF4261 domain-containing protein [Priestia]|nr:DUF4261 domain-containing protein [Priestia megaterium]MBK0293733.1 DUF4261 domain-containing protein [Bacillus sp. S34]PHF76138.1 hypothetical protein COI42_07095 [Priestia aryabhattai]UOO38956.1 DUF4261 domain-containing protein [Priestia megaterium]
MVQRTEHLLLSFKCLEKKMCFTPVVCIIFGYKDLLTSTSNTNPAETVELFQTFCLYTLIENPVFNSGETFSVDPKAPVFQLREESCVLFESDDPFYNPYGVWRLNKIS